MPELELTAGVIEYEDTGGRAPVLVLLGGLVMDSSVWGPVVAELRDEFRCVVPTLPLGAHRRPMRADADLTLARYGRAARKREMLAVCDRLRNFTRPALVVWTPEDRVQRPKHGARLAELLPDARLVQVADSYTLIVRDQPRVFASAIREFVHETTAARA